MATPDPANSASHLAGDGTDVPRIGPTIRAAREAAQLSLDQLAARVDCAKSYLSAIETEQRNPPREPMLRKIEAALGMPEGVLVERALLQRSLQVGGVPMREELARWQRDQQVVHKLRLALERARARDPASAGGLSSHEVRRLLGLFSSTQAGTTPHPDGGRAAHPGPSRTRTAHVSGPMMVELALEVPLINSVAAGYPREFTDLGYPARVADEYVRCPDVRDADAFAARVVGDSMEPAYREGDIVIFSPAKALKDGQDCFVRIEPDHETTFKRVYFEKDAKGREVIRLQPLNNKYPPRQVARELVAGLYAAVSVMRTIA